MRKLESGITVPAGAYYYLVDWKNDNPERFYELTQRHSVNTLTEREFKLAFTEAAKSDNLLIAPYVCQS